MHFPLGWGGKVGLSIKAKCNGNRPACHKQWRIRSMWLKHALRPEEMKNSIRSVWLDMDVSILYSVLFFTFFSYNIRRLFIWSVRGKNTTFPKWWQTETLPFHSRPRAPVLIATCLQALVEVRQAVVDVAREHVPVTWWNNKFCSLSWRKQTLKIRESSSPDSPQSSSQPANIIDADIEA